MDTIKNLIAPVLSQESKPYAPVIGTSFLLFVFVCTLIFPQIANATLYQPGQTLEPDCAPGTLNCGVAVVASSLGTTSAIANSVLTVQATSTDSILATLRAFAGQVANLFQVQDSSGANLFGINASGGLTLGGLNGLLYANNGLVSAVATSSLGLLTTNVAEGSNLYFTNARVDAQLSATTSLPNIATLSGLSLSATQLTNFGTPFSTFFSATTTDALTQGSTNKYYNDSLVQSFIHASSTIPKTYAANIFTGAQTLNGGLTIDSLNGPLQANNGLISATTSIGVLYGGTGATSFGQGWLFSSGGGNALSASTSPTVNYITATSTTATSTFANGINITSGCVAKNGTCIGITSDLQYVTSYKPNDTFTNITSGTTTLTTVSITPSTATGDVMVRAGVTFTSSNGTDQPVSLAIRQTNCTGTILQSTLFTVAAGAGAEYYQLDLNYVAVDPGASSQTYAFCISASAGDTDVSAWSMSAVVVDTGADVAEIYTTNDASLEAGDVVSLDPNLATGVQKTVHAYDQNVLGIVSTKPGMIIGGVNKEGVKALPIALAGRVPVKVVTENGAIKPGDYLTPSSVPGVAMSARGGKAMGPVIGQAMWAYDGKGVGMVLAFVKNFDLDAGAVLMGDISPKVNADGSNNGISALVAAVQSETARDPVAIIAQKITAGTQFLTDFVAARVTALRGYFDEVFAKKVRTEQLCVRKSDGNEVCVNGDQVDTLLQKAALVPAETPPASNISLQPEIVLPEPSAPAVEQPANPAPVDVLQP